MADVGGVFFRIGGKFAGISTAIEALMKDVDTAGTKAGSTFSNSFAKSIQGSNAARQAAAKAASDASAAAESASQRTVDAYARQENAVGKARVAESALNDARAKYSADSTQYIRAEENYERAKRNTILASRDVETALHEEALANDALFDAQGRVDGAMDARTARLSAWGTAGVAGFAAFGYAADKAVQAAGNFQQSQEKLVTTADLQQQSLSTVSQGILDMAGKVGISAQDLSTAMYTVSSGMVHVKDPAKDAANSLEILKAAAQGAAEEKAPLGEVADALTTALKDYHLGAGQAADEMSKLITAVAHGKTNLGEFSTGLSQVASQAATAGISFDDLLTAMAEMTSHGIHAEQGAQNINNTLTAFAKPSQQMTDAMASVGINSANLDKMLGTEGLTGTVQTLSDAVIKHLNPATNTVLVGAFNQSATAAQSAKEAYDSLTPSLQHYVDLIKQGAIPNNVKQIEKMGGLDLQDATRVNQAATAYQKSVGLNANLKADKNNDKDYQQYMQTLVGGIPNWRVVSQLTGQNAPVATATHQDITAAKAYANGDVFGWQKIQDNYNQQVNDFKASLGSLKIEMGDHLLPIASKLVGVMSKMANYFEQNKTLAEGLIGTVGALTAAATLVKGVDFLGKGLGAEHAGTTGVRKALGLGKKALVGGPAEEGEEKSLGGLAGLAKKGITGGAKAAASGARSLGNLPGAAADYWNWTGKAKATNAVDAVKSGGTRVAEAAKSGGRAVADTAVDMAAGAKNLGGAALGGIKSGASALKDFSIASKDAAKDFGALAKGNLASGFSAVTSGIKTGVTAVKDFEVGAKLASAATKVWTGVQAAFDVVMDANPISLVVIAIAALVGGVILAYKHSATFRDIVKDIGTWCMNVAKDIGNFFVAAFKDVSHWVGDAWNWIKKFHDVLLLAMGPVGVVIIGIEQLVKHWGVLTDAVKDGGKWVGQVWSDIKTGWDVLWTNDLQPAWKDVQKGWSDIYNVTIKPVSDLIGKSWSGIKDAAKDMVDWIEQQWDRIKGIVTEPAKFIINTVYDGGIVPLWNGIAHVFGLNTIDKVVLNGFSGGGVYDSYGVVPGRPAPGNDSVRAHSNPGDAWLVPEVVRAVGPGSINALNAGKSAFAGGGVANSMVSPGEARITPAAVQALGGPRGVWEINHQYSRRPNANGAVPGVHFAGGGLWGDITGAVSDVGSWVSKAVGTAADWVTDPVGKLKGLFKPWIDKAMGAPDGGQGNQWWKAITSVPQKLLDGAVDKVKSAVSSLFSSGGGILANVGQINQWITAALQALGLPVTAAWIKGYDTLIGRESSGNTNAINLGDSNAAAGHPSRGLTQTIPSTFEANRAPNLPDNIVDPVANIAASINYVRRNYGVKDDGSNLSSAVQQADPSRPPKGYAGGGIAGLTMRQVLRFDGGGVTPDDTSTSTDSTSTDGTGNTTTVTPGAPGAPSTPASGGPVIAVNWLKDHSSIPYVYGGGSVNGLDCSGLVGFGYQLATGNQNPSGRIGTTTSMMAGQWPHMIRGASSSDIFIAGTNADHMVMSILGTGFEERTSGETMRVGDQAASPFDGQFTEQWHLDPTAFVPAYNAGSAGTYGGTGTITTTPGDNSTSTLTAAQRQALQVKIQKANDDIAKDKATAAKEQQLEKTYLAQAQAEDAKAAAAKTVAERVRATTSATKYRADAQRADELAKKYLADAQTTQNQIQQYQTELTGGTKTKSTSSDNSTDSLTWHDMWSKAGGVLGDAISQSTGLDNGSLSLESITESPLWKIGSAISGAKIGKPYTPSILTDPSDSDDSSSGSGDSGDKTLNQLVSSGVGNLSTKAAPGKRTTEKSKVPIYDEGGYLPQTDVGGISVVPVAKGVRRPERVLNADHTEKLDRILDGASAGGGHVHNGPILQVDRLINEGGSHHDQAREIDRWVAPYFLRMPR